MENRKKKRGRRIEPAGAEQPATEAPLIDQDTLAIFLNQTGEGAPPTPGDATLFREGIYASTKGAHLVNDGIGYGEMTVERFRYVNSENELVVMIRRSVRTRTGRQTVVEKGGT